jgi:hypothetical protein
MRRTFANGKPAPKLAYGEFSETASLRAGNSAVSIPLTDT